MLSTFAPLSTAAECNVPSNEKWGDASKAYRRPPIVDVQGNNVYLGWLPEYQACESRGWSSGYSAPPGDDTGIYETFYNYNYAWNAETGTRDFWGQDENGNDQKVSWYKSRPYGYEKNSWNPFSTQRCQIPSSSKFLGETCTDKSDCVNGFTERFVDVTYSPVTPEEDSDYKCVFDEESGGDITLDNNICSCFGLLWCESDDCAGNQCVLSTYDGNKHCKYADEPLFGSWFGAGACSNCRTSDDACEAFNGSDAATTDTSQIAIDAGYVGLGGIVLLGVGFATRRTINKRRGMAPSDNNEAGTEMTNNPVTPNVV